MRNNLIIFQKQKNFEDLIKKNKASNPIVVWQGVSHPDVISLALACRELGCWFLPLRKISEFSHVLSDHNLLLFGIDISEGVLQLKNNLSMDLPTNGGMILPTSGTKDKAKLCLLPWDMVAANIKAAQKIFKDFDLKKAVISSSIFSTAGWNTLLFCFLENDIQVDIHHDFNVYGILRSLKENSCTAYHFSPLQAGILWEARKPDSGPFGSQNVCVVGSSDVYRKSIVPYLENKISFIRNYGLTEAGPYVYSSKTDKNDLLTGAIVNLGTLSEGMESELSLKEGSSDLFRLKLNGDAIFSGYLGEVPRQRTDWFSTGDLVSIDKTGRSLFFECRECDLIHLGEQLLSPNRIEGELMDEFPFVRECRFQAGKPFSLDIELLVAGHFSLDKYFKKMEHFLHSKINFNHMSITQVKRLLRNASGKIIRTSNILSVGLNEV